MTDIEDEMDNLLKDMKLTKEQKSIIALIINKKINEIINEKVDNGFNIEQIRKLRPELIKLKDLFNQVIKQ